MAHVQDGPHSVTKSRRVLAFAWSVVLFVAFCGLGQTAATISVRFPSPPTASSSGEVYFWLGHALLLVPSGLLLGYAIAPQVAALLAHFDRELRKLAPREVRMGLLSLYLFAVGMARAMHALIMLDRPITDEESAARFGGRLLTHGLLSIQPPPLFEFMPNRFLHVGPTGLVSSMDWIGVQAAWAVGELIHQPPLVFAALAALPVPAIGYAVGKLLGRPWAAFAMVFLVLSPMGVALTATADAHVLSRGFIALTFALGVAAVQGGKSHAFAWVGLAAGAAFLCRPFETAALLVPFAIHQMRKAAAGNGQAKRELGFAVLGLALPAALFFYVNLRITGDAFVPAQWTDGVLGVTHPPLPNISVGQYLWRQFGNNVSYNFFMLCVWFMGPVGVGLVMLGAMTNGLTKLLAAGVALSLFLALGNENAGIHSVGPILFSECLVPLTVLAVYGFRRSCTWLTHFRIDAMQWCAVLLVGLMLSLGTFNYWHAAALHRQAGTHDELLRILEHDRLPKSILFVPNYSKLWHSFPDYVSRGGVVFEWNRNEPDASDHLLLMRYAPGREELAQKAYPDRKLLRLHRVNDATSGEPGVAILPARIVREQAIPLE